MSVEGDLALQYLAEIDALKARVEELERERETADVRLTEYRARSERWLRRAERAEARVEESERNLDACMKMAAAEAYARATEAVFESALQSRVEELEHLAHKEETP